MKQVSTMKSRGVVICEHNLKKMECRKCWLKGIQK